MSIEFEFLVRSITFQLLQPAADFQFLVRTIEFDLQP